MHVYFVWTQGSSGIQSLDPIFGTVFRLRKQNAQIKPELVAVVKIVQCKFIELYCLIILPKFFVAFGLNGHQVFVFLTLIFVGQCAFIFSESRQNFDCTCLYNEGFKARIDLAHLDK